MLESPQSKFENNFPSEIEIYCETLFKIGEGFKTIEFFCADAKKQLEAIKQIDKYEEQPVLFLSWTIDDVIVFVNNLYESYRQELANKLLIIGMLIKQLFYIEYIIYVIKIFVRL